MTRTTTAVLAVSALAGLAAAAPITWNQPVEFESTADIALPGPVVYAFNGGDSIGNEPFIPGSVLATMGETITVDVNGTPVAFEGIADVAYGFDAVFGMLGFPYETFGDAVSNLPGDNTNVTLDVTDYRTSPFPQVSFDPMPATLLDPPEERNYQVPTGNNDLDTVLNSTAFYDGRGIGSSALNITLHNLTPGTDYHVQLIGAADARDRPGKIPTDTVNDGEGNAMPGLAAFVDIDNDGVSHVATITGTFTASASTQAINVVLEDGRNGGIAAIILTEVTTTTGPCNSADLAAPFGTLNFADVQSFLGSFGAGLPAADLAAPQGTFNFADVQSFLGLFGSGC